MDKPLEKPGFFHGSLRVSITELPGAVGGMQALIPVWLLQCKQSGLIGCNCLPAQKFEDGRVGFVWTFSDKESYEVEVKQMDCAFKPARKAYTIPVIKRTLSLQVEVWNK